MSKHIVDFMIISLTEPEKLLLYNTEPFEMFETQKNLTLPVLRNTFQSLRSETSQICTEDVGGNVCVFS